MSSPAKRPGLAIAALHLFGVAGFAVAQPLFDVLARYPAFLVAHQATPRDLVALTLCVLVAPAAAVFAVVALGRLLGRGLGWALLLCALALGIVCTALPPLARAAGLAPLAALAVAALLGAAGAAAYARSAQLRSLMTLLGAAPLVFAALFLFTEPIARLVAGTPDFRAVAGEAEHDVPIVMVVLDEFSTDTLLDASGEIDAVRFPRLAELAREATWYRNAHTVHTSTIQSLPAILTGRFPETDRLPWAADYPESLFTLLSGTYDMHVVESETMLWPESDDANLEGERGNVLAALLSDVTLIGLHVLLPEQWASGLPSIREAWGRFARPREHDFATFAQKAIWVGFRDRLTRFRSFVGEIEACERRCFHFLHILLPHRPWELLPSTRKYVPWTAHGLVKKEEWGDDAWRVDQAHQQYLLQSMATDRLVGELVDRMRETGVWDRALFVLLADHGVSFWESESMRWIDDQTHPEDVIRIPLFVKLPGQSGGATVDRPVLTIDIVPTIARVLGLELPWEVEGCPLDDAACAAEPERDRARIVTLRHETRRIPDDVDTRRASLERKLRLFGSGEASLFAFGPHRELVGQRVDALPVRGTSPYTGRIDRRAPSSVEAAPAKFALARISGFLRRRDGEPAAPGERPAAALAIDGVVQAVAPGYRHAAGSLSFSALVPEYSVGPGEHRLQIYTVAAGPGAEVVLEPAGEEQLTVPEADDGE